MFSLMKDDIKKLRHVIILYCGFLGFGYLLSAFSYETTNVLSYSILFIVLSCVIMIIPIINYQYLHNRTSATHILSLPYTKGQIFLVRYLSGLCVVLIPSILYIIALSFVKDISLSTGLITIIFTILIYYTLGCLVANLTGTLIMHIFMFVVITVLPLVLYVSLNSMFSEYVKGLSGTSLLESVVALLMPISQLLLAAIEGELSLYYVAIYSLYAAILCIVAMASSIKRPFERTGEPIAFHKIDSIIKLFVIICFSWVLTALLSFGEHIVLMAIIAIVVVCIVVELIMHKTLHYKKICLEIGGVLILTTGIYLVSVNYLETLIPSNVTSASIRFDKYATNDYDSKINNEEAISLIKDIHQYLIDTPESKADNEDGGIRIAYTLSNGDVVTRMYTTDIKTTRTVLNKVVSSEAKKVFVTEYFSYLDKLIDGEYTEMVYNQYALEDETVLEGQQLSRFQKALEKQKERFINNPELFKDIVFQREFYDNYDYYGDLSVTISKNNRYTLDNNYTIYRNDPIYFAIQEYVKK